MATKRSGAAPRMPKAKKIPKPAYKVRQQVLAMDSLLDVFDYVDRHTLDDANVVSAAYNATAQRAPPLRIVTDALFSHDPEEQTFRVTAYYNTPYVGRTKNKRKALKLVASNMEEAVVIFFRCIRFSNVSRFIRLSAIHIQQLFLDQLKAVAKEFLCKAKNVYFIDVTLADCVHAMDLLLEFPSFRALNVSFNLLEKSIGNNDELLKAAASRGAFCLFVKEFFYGRSFSEAAILDYTFGDYNDNGELRKLKVHYPAVSRKFLVNLVQACRECRSELKVDLEIPSIQRALAVDELVANGEKHWNDDGVWYVWRFRFDDLPELNVQYTPPYHPRTSSILPWSRHNWRDAELRCWGTIRGSAANVV